MAGNNNQVNYEDERFQQVEADKQKTMTEVDQTYDNMIGQSDSFYQEQIDASKQWEETQKQLQQEQTDFTIEQIEQEKDKAYKDYLKEQSGAYVDWQKQSNQYGANAEAMAAGGFTGTGYSESSQVSMYNTYQNRVAAARESYNAAVLNYNNAIKDARLQNNAALAEIAYTALQQQLELSLQGFQYKNQLILDQTNKKIELDNMYYQRSQDILAQINHENAMAEEIRQYNASLAEEQRQYNQDYKEKVRQFNEEIKRLKDKDAKEYALEIKNLELKKQQLAEEKRQFDAQMKQKEASLIKSSSSSGSSGSSSSSKKSGSASINKNSSGGSGTTIDNKSVLDLGYGPISGDRLAELVTQGKATVTQQGNKLVAKKTNSLTSAQGLLNKYTWLK